MKIDIHTHLLPPDLPNWKSRFGYGGFLGLERHSCGARLMRDDGTFFREVQANCWDPQARLTDCDASGVTHQVLSTIPGLFHYWAKPQDGFDTARYLNDHLAQVVAQGGGRFFGLGTLPMQDADMACREMARCVNELQLSGVQIGTHVNGLNLDEGPAFAVLSEAEKLGASVFVHPWDMLAPDRMKRYWLPWLVGMPAELSVALASLAFGGVMERLPRLRIAFAHGGGGTAALLGRWRQGFTARPDLCQTHTKHPPDVALRKVYVDTLVHDPAVLELIRGVFGEDRLLLGSDYPFPLGESRPGEIVDLITWPKPLREKVFAQNALRWLGKLPHE